MFDLGSANGQVETIALQHANPDGVLDVRHA